MKSSPMVVVLDGQSLPVADVVRLAHGAARPVPGTEAMKRVEESWHAARELAASGRVYGRSTGIGANRSEAVPTGAAADHGLRLLRGHAGAIGSTLPAREVRAMLAVRANRLLAGGAGLRPTVVSALCEALESGAHPVVNEYGPVGTGDSAALAQVGLALAGEQPWLGGTVLSRASRSRPVSPRPPPVRRCARVTRTVMSSAANSSPAYARCASATCAPTRRSRSAAPSRSRTPRSTPTTRTARSPMM